MAGPGEAGDSSVRAPEVQRPVVVLVAGFGLASVLFCIAAELGRVRSYQVSEVETGHEVCSYPPSSSMWYAVAAMGAMVLTQAAGFTYGSFSWCPNRRHTSIYSASRTSVAVVLITQLVFAAAAAATLMTAAMEDQALPPTPLKGETGIQSCYLLDDGVFLTAAILALFSTILIEAYYILSIRVKRDLWMDAYSAGPIDGIEMLDHDTAVLPVNALAHTPEVMESDDDILGDSDFLPSFGQKQGNMGRIPRP